MVMLIDDNDGRLYMMVIIIIILVMEMMITDVDGWVTMVSVGDYWW